MESPALTYKEGFWIEYHNIDMYGLGDVELIHDWKSKMSIDDLKRKAEENDWSAISIGVNFALMKSFPYQLKASHCKPTPGSNTFYIYTPSRSYRKPYLEELEMEKEREWKRLTDRCTTGGSWARYKNIDMLGKGDKEFILNGKSLSTLEDWMKMVEEKNWSAISVVDFNYADFKYAAIKSFRYQLDASHCDPCDGYTNTFYIYTRPPGSKPPSDCCTIN